MMNACDTTSAKLSIKIHHFLVIDYGKWSGPHQVMSVSSEGVPLSKVARTTTTMVTIIRNIRQVYSTGESEDRAQALALMNRQ